jgi:hypothetical protein
MNKIIITLLVISFNVQAQLDFSLGGSARTWPSIGGEFNAESGYNMVFWGAGDKKNPLYGLIRPALKVATSAVISNYDARFEFYPISFISLAAGHKYIKSDYDQFSFYDCDKVRCKGELRRDYTEFKMAMAYAGVTAMGKVVMSRNSYDDKKEENKPVAEFRFAALANPGSDTMYNSQYVLGYKMLGGMIGVMSEYVKFDDADHTYNMDLLIYTTKKNSSSYIYGIGQFVSTHWSGRGLIGVFQMKTDFLPSKKLF